MCETDDPSAVHDYDDDPLPGAAAIEAVIEATGDDPAMDAAVLHLVQRATLYVLGTPTSGRDGGYILHCPSQQGGTVDYVPVFTRYRYADAAIFSHPKWITLEVWKVKGTDILADLQPHEWLGINAWAVGSEFGLPPEARWPRAA